MAGPLDGALAILGQGQPKGATDPVWQIPADVQRQRDADSVALMQQERAKETDPTRQAMLDRQIAARSKAAAPDYGNSPVGGALAILGGQYQSPATPQQRQAPSLIDRVGGAVHDAAKTVEGEIRGASDTLLHYGTSLFASTLPALDAFVGSTVDNVRNGKFGTPEGANATEKRVGEAIDRYTYQPTSTEGQRNVRAIGDFLNSTGIQGVPLPELNNLATASRPVVGSAGNAVRGATTAPATAAEAPKPRVKLNVDGSISEVSQPTQAANVSRPTMPEAASAESTVTDAPLPIQDQRQRAQVLNDVGIKNARRSIVTGDKQAASTDWETAKLDSPAGKLMSGKFDEERAALEQYADSTVKLTGGTPGTDQARLYARGNAIVAPLDDLKDWFDSRTSALYKAADERAQGVPTQLDSFKSVLSDDSNLTNSDRVYLRDAVNAYGKKLGVVDENGNFVGNAQQAETIRKYLNENWSPQNSKFVGALKDALDDDVLSAAGDDIYGQARAMRGLRAQTLDDPKGIAKLIDSSGPGGINRAVATEKIPDAVTGMSVDQFGHVVDTLKSVPEELQPKAQAALAEIKAQFANKVADIGRSYKGEWNAKGVRDYLSSNKEQMAKLFTPEELQRFETLRKAGDIIATGRGYVGAAAQQHNLLSKGTMGIVKNAPTAIGAKVLGPAGAMAGAYVGSKAAGALELKAAQKRLVPVSSLLDVGK